MHFSETDLKLLRLIQSDLSQSRQELSSKSGMSNTTLWRRINDLETAGVISKRVALLDPDKAGFPECIFVSVNLANHEKLTREDFENTVQLDDRIMQCFSVTGQYDYLLIVRARSVSDFEKFLMDKILGHNSVASASSQIALRQQKNSTALPI